MSQIRAPSFSTESTEAAEPRQPARSRLWLRRADSIGRIGSERNIVSGGSSDFDFGPEFAGPVCANKVGCRWLVCMLVSLLATFVIIGMQSPPYLRTNSSGKSVVICQGDENGCNNCANGSKFNVTIDSMQRGHQFAIVDLAFVSPNERPPAVQTHLGMELWGTNLPDGKSTNELLLNATGASDHIRTFSCDNGPNTLCKVERLAGLSLVQFESYRLMVSFEGPALLPFCRFSPELSKYQVTAMMYLDFASPTFTTFELVFKYVLIIVTVALQTAFCAKIRRQGGPWAYEQYWASILMIGLIFFNDPLAAAEIYSDDAGLFQMLHLLSACTFLAVVLFFWLLAPSRVAFNAHQVKMKSGEIHAPSKIVSAPSGNDTLEHESCSHVGDTSKPAKQFQTNSIDVNINLGNLSVDTSMSNRGYRRQAFGVHEEQSQVQRENSVGQIHGRDRRTKPEKCPGIFIICQFPKRASLCFVIWFGGLISQAGIRAEQINDPSFNPMEDIGHFWAFIALALVTLLFYLVQFSCLAAKGVMLSRFMVESDAFVFVSTLITLSFFTGAIVTGSMTAALDHTSGLSLALLHGVFTSYVWMLTIAFMPMGPFAPTNPNSNQEIFSPSLELGPIDLGSRTVAMHSLNFGTPGNTAESPDDLRSPLYSPTRDEEQVIFEERNLMAATV